MSERLLPSRKSGGTDAVMGVVAIFSTLLLVLAVVDRWSDGYVGLFTFTMGLGYGWCLKR